MSRFLLLFSISLLNFVIRLNAMDQDCIRKMIDDIDLNVSMLDLSATPNSIVGGVVNVITGNYVESEIDLIVPSANPIIRRRTYCGGWSYNNPGSLHFFLKDEETQCAVHHDSDATFLFEGERKKRFSVLKIEKEQMDEGVTNCSKGFLGKGSNFLNRDVYYSPKSKHCTVSKEDGSAIYYESYERDKQIEQSIFHPKITFLSNGHRLSYKKNMKYIYSQDRSNNELCFIKYKDYWYKNKETWTASNGSMVSYHYTSKKKKKKKNSYYIYLSKVIRDHAPEINYEYNLKGGHLLKKVLPNNRYLQMQYYLRGQNDVNGFLSYKIENKWSSLLNRVAAIYAPAGTDTSPVVLWAFSYDPFNQTTTVYDALHHKQIFRYSKKRLTSIQAFTDNGNIYREEVLNWGGEPSMFLKSKGVKDHDGNVHLCRKFEYDKEGNVLKECFHGNLTGRSTTYPTFNQEDHSEKFIKLYKPFLTEDDGRKKISYRYLKGTDLVTLKLISDREKICERVHYTYDDKTMIQEIIDDGSSEDITNLSNVTQRRIKRIIPTLKHPIGLPGTVEEWFLNIATGCEEKISKIENIYSIKGHLLEQLVYDANDQYCYSKRWTYDEKGNVVEEIDPLGQITIYKYDENKNRIFKQGPDLSFYTTYGYDFVNRLIKEENVYEDGRVLTISFTYDYLGNRTSSTDAYGNTTHFRYDEFNRLIEKIYPPVANSHGEFVQLSDKVGYDILNNPVEKTDTNGHITKRKYTAWGKPYHIEHPDGAVENLYYHLDGVLEKTIDAIGVETLYTHDYKGRKTSEEKFSQSGETLSRHQWNYDAFNLISEINPAGQETSYSYDGAGRLIGIKKGTAETRYVYDSLGRQTEVWELYEIGKYRKTIKNYDNLNRVIHEAITDECNNVFSSQSYRYDCYGNRTHVIIHDDHADLCTVTLYNSDKKPVKIIQPDGNEVNYIYHYDYKNEQNQNVACIEEVDPSGKHSVKIMDTCGRLACEQKKDALGKILQKTTYHHDGEGNLINRVDDVLLDGIYQRSIKTEFLYDSRNRVIATIEAAGEPIQKVNRKEYSPRGELAKMIKPDGIILYHVYDDLGRLINQHSTDGSINYTYTYDLNNNITIVKDEVANTITTRFYDQKGMMISEELANSKKFAYQYDARGRVKQVVLPDQTSIDYHYNAANLRSIVRQKKESFFTCDYQFNLTGKIAQINLPNRAVNCFYDVCLRPVKIESQNWSQEIPEGGYDACGNVLQVKQKDCVSEQLSSYSYDDLHHLVSETGGSNHTYRFDSLHNRLSKDEIVYNVNSLNQLSAQGDCNYEYDPNGNQSKKIISSSNAVYHYDALDRMTSIVMENKKIEYTYDPFHRRMKKNTFELQDENWVEVDVISYLYQGDKEIGALNKEGQIFELRVLGLGNKSEIGAAVFIEINDETYCPLHDFRGNITALSRTCDGTIVECYRYTAYGEEQLYNADGQKAETILCPWRFSSKRIDAETGWVYFGRRYYDPEVGKWTTPDPLGFKDSANVYCFVRNRPLIYIDPDGRMAVEANVTFTADDKRFFTYERFVNSLYCGSIRTYDGDEYVGVEFPYFNYSGVYTVGKPVNDGLEIGLVNGMSNNKDQGLESAQLLSDMAGGREVRLIHNASFGMFDPFECAINMARVETRPSQLIRGVLDNHFDNGGREYLLFGHSQGNLHIRNAIYGYDEERLKHVHVRSIATAAYMPRDTFGSAIHYNSRNDIVPWFDWFFGGTIDCAPTITLEPHPDAYWFDHSFSSPTYELPMMNEIDKFLMQFGIIP